MVAAIVNRGVSLANSLSNYPPLKQIKTTSAFVVEKIEGIIRAFFQFFESFHHPSSHETRLRSQERDKVRSKPWSKLLDAAYFHHNDTLVTLLRTNNPNMHDCDGSTALHAASISGNLAAIPILLHAGADINAKDMRGQAPIHLAARNGHTAIVNFFATRGANIDLPDMRGKTPLRCAAKYGHLDAVSSLIALGANKEAQDAKRQTPYFVACLQGRMHVAHYLQALGANRELVNIDGKKADQVMGRAGLRAFVRYCLS